MRKNSQKRDPIPKHFKSTEEAAEFWDSHDLTGFWDMTSAAHFDVEYPATDVFDSIKN